MKLKQFIYNHIKDSTKYRFVIQTQECDFINTSGKELAFYELFQIVGIALLDCEVKVIFFKDNKCRIVVEINDTMGQNRRN